MPTGISIRPVSLLQFIAIISRPATITNHEPWIYKTNIDSTMNILHSSNNKSELKWKILLCSSITFTRG